jgi:cyanophycin synthetase
VDYAHNVPALRAVIQAVDGFPGARRVAVYSSAGDRRDEDIRTMGALLGAAFDRVILYEDTDLYEREPGEIVALLKEGLFQGARVSEVEVVDGGLNALQHALATVEPGDLALVQAHLANPTIEFLKEWLTRNPPTGR